LRDSGWYASNGVIEPDLRQSLDLVGLATVCDVVPLIGVNRAFVRAGLARAPERPGLKALAGIARATAPYTSYHFGFVLGPRINAGGRVGRSSLGVDLLCAPEEAAAVPIAEMLDRHNRERQAIERLILEAALAQAAVQDNAPFVLVSGEGWHSGVVGIVAGRLKDRFSRPALAIGFENGLGRGSARSIAGIDIGALLRRAHAAGYLEAAGGHAMAAGFSLLEANVGPLAEFLGHELAGAGAALGEARGLTLDALLTPSGANHAFIEQIRLAGPFGAGNPEPLLGMADLRVSYVGATAGGHVRARLEGSDGACVPVIAFRAAGSPIGDGLLRDRGKRVHAVGQLKPDTHNGGNRIQFVLEDAAPAQP